MYVEYILIVWNNKTHSKTWGDGSAGAGSADDRGLGSHYIIGIQATWIANELVKHERKYFLAILWN